MLKRNNFREICVYLHAKTIKRKKIMARTTARRRTSQPIMKAWNAVKGLDYSDKLELVTMIIESVKADKADDEEYSLRPFTMEELNARLDQAEAEIAAGLGTPHEEVMREMDEEIERWEQEEFQLETAQAL